MIVLVGATIDMEMSIIGQLIIALNSPSEGIVNPNMTIKMQRIEQSLCVPIYHEEQDNKNQWWKANNGLPKWKRRK